MSFITKIKEHVISGSAVSFAQAQQLFQQELGALCAAADEIRAHFCGNTFDLCTIINAKSGRCSEDCKYCAQSAHYQTTCEEYPLLSEQTLVEGAVYNSDKGVLHYSLVTSGRNISDAEVARVCDIVARIKLAAPIKICGSFGLLQQAQYQKLHDAGLTRIHNNLETSKDYFPHMCTTHTFGDKMEAISHARAAGMEICSGGIFGIGESADDQISLAFSLKDLQVKSVPLNLLSPIQGTPYQNNTPLTASEFRRIVAVYRFILPDAFLRLAGGRGLLADQGRDCFLSGANATITGDMLTTTGISIETDLLLIKALGFEVR